MKANVVYFAVICMFVRYTSADDAAVDCTKPTRHVPLQICCPVPDLSTADLMEQCAQFVGPPPPPPMAMGNDGPQPPRAGPPMRPHLHPHPPHLRGLHPHPCLIECIFNKTEVIEGSAELNGDKFKELLDTALQGNEEMAAVMADSFETCSEKVTELKAKIAEKLSKSPEFAEKIAKHKLNAACSPFAAMFMTCINMETFQNCPESAWNNSDECNTARKYITECKRT